MCNHFIRVVNSIVGEFNHYGQCSRLDAMLRETYGDGIVTEPELQATIYNVNYLELSCPTSYIIYQYVPIHVGK